MPRSCLTPAIHEDQKQAEQELLYELDKQKKREKNPHANRKGDRDARSFRRGVETRGTDGSPAKISVAGKRVVAS